MEVSFLKIKTEKFVFFFKTIFEKKHIILTPLLPIFVIREKTINFEQLQFFLQLFLRSSIVIRHRLA